MGERWGWLVVVPWLVSLGAVAALFALGGMGRVVGWVFLLHLVPLGASLVLVPTLAAWAWRRRLGRPGRVLLGTGLLAVLPAALVLRPVPYPFAPTTPAVAVRVPTDRPMRVVWGGDAMATNYHAADPAQRWAYDLVIEPAGHGAASNAAYGCYGVEVRAPAAGRVTVAENGHPDGDPAHFVPNYAAPAGNHVSLRLATGTHLVVAHLAPGSVAVEVGDDVEEGALLGRCGNSGNSSEPHVHLHHQRQDPALIGLLAEGLPLRFRDLQGVAGEYAPVGGVVLEGDRVAFVGDVITASTR